MDWYFFSAGIVIFLVGVIHSILGEILIFRHLRDSGIVPTKSAAPLEPHHIKILWATWHLASIFGFSFSAILFSYAVSFDNVLIITREAIAVGCALGAVLVFIARKGRHPGWAGLLIVFILLWLQQNA